MNFEKDISRIKEEKVYEANKLVKKEINYDLIGQNAEVLGHELNWLKGLIRQRLEWMKDEESRSEGLDITPPVIIHPNTPYGQFVHKYQLKREERLLLIIALAPAYQPEVFSPLLEKERGFRIKYDEFGGITDNLNFQFLPTLKTLVYLIAGENAELTGKYFTRYIEENRLLDEQIIVFRNLSQDSDRIINHELRLIPEYVAHLTRGKETLPAFSSDFPAKQLITPYALDDLVVGSFTKERLQLIIDWVNFRDKVLERQGASKKVKEGFPVLFYGPPGTGKTMAASIIGKLSGKEVFQIDLSMVVSKYIGETEKNLARLFDKAERKDWILFFDEADSLFGKRGQVKDAHDKYANQEMSFLLQRMEQFTGLTILATNFDQNLDPALTRRFQAKVYFPRPEKEERELLWQKCLPEGYCYEADLPISKLAEKFVLTGANISNILKICCVRSEKRGENKIIINDILDAVRIEYSKENKTF